MTAAPTYGPTPPEAESPLAAVTEQDVKVTAGFCNMSCRMRRAIVLFVFPVLVGGLLPATHMNPAVSAQQLGPELMLLDSIVLQETDTLYIGQPKEMFLGPDSSLYVMAFGNAVVRFDQRGRVIRRFGREGDGPGEFVHIGKAGFASATVLGIVDGRGAVPRAEIASTQVIELFAVESGASIGSARVMEVTALALNRDTLWLGGIDVGADWKAMTARELPGLHRQPSGEAISLDLVPVPRPYRVNQLIHGLGGYVRLHVTDDDVVIGFGAIPYLLRVTKGGTVRDTIALRARQRAWVRDEEELLRVMDPAAPAEGRFGATSALMNISRDGRGRIFTVHQESRSIGPRRVQGTLYVSKLEGDGNGQCPDTHIPTSDVGRPISAFRGDELFVLDQRIRASGASALETVVRRYRIDPERCTGRIIRDPALPGGSSDQVGHGREAGPQQLPGRSPATMGRGGRGR